MKSPRKLPFTAMALSLLLPLVTQADTKAEPPPPPSIITPSADCGQESGGAFDFRFCIYRTPDSQSNDVIWFLHGRSGSEHSWEKEGHYRRIRALWAAQNKNDIPTVIAVTFGPQWLLTPQLSKPKSGMLEFFETSVIPMLERRMGGLKGRRLLMGESMGSFGAAELLLSHRIHFDKVALGCPAIAWLSPFAKFADIAGWAKQTGVSLLTALSVVATARGFYASTGEWESASPLYLARLGLGAETPPLWISIGEEDTYGFYPGTRDFMNMAKMQSSGPVIWAPVQGPHCSFDEASVASFLLD